MKIIQANHKGFCFGVRDAVMMARTIAQSEPMTVYGDLVHNRDVLDRLASDGVRVGTRYEDLTTETVMITAHGASDRVKDELRARGHKVIEATCPLVRSAHEKLNRLVGQGYYPVIIGLQNHVEVRGLTGDLLQHSVVISEAEMEALPEMRRFGVIAQTTQPLAKVERLVSHLREHRPGAEVRFVDTVCQPTKQRQAAATELAMQCDVVVVVGGAASNNTRELVKTCEEECARVHHVQNAGEICEGWFCQDDTVGVTAGTSTPDWVIAEVVRTLNQWVLKKTKADNLKS